MSEPAKDEAELLEQVVLTTCECHPGECYVKMGQMLCCAEDDKVEAVFAAIRKAGWAVVPVDPTDEMLWAADRAPAPTWEMDNPDHAEFVLFAVRRAEWAAMLKAAPGVKP
jgi:hypothetical protein